MIDQLLRPSGSVILFILGPNSVQYDFLIVSWLHDSWVSFFTVGGVLRLKLEFEERVDRVLLWLSEHTQSITRGISSLETRIKSFLVSCHYFWTHDRMLGVENRNSNSFSFCHKTAILPICLAHGVAIIFACIMISIGKSHRSNVGSCLRHCLLLASSIPLKLLVFCSGCISWHKSPIFIVEYIWGFEFWRHLSIINVQQTLLALPGFLIGDWYMIFGKFKWIISNCLVLLDSLAHSSQ